MSVAMSECSETSPNYEAQFAQRFTAEDVEFQRCVQRTPPPPPVLQDWRARGPAAGQRRFQDGRQHGRQEWDRGRDCGRGRSWSNEGRTPHGWQERRWGSGGGEHNSYNRRPRYDR